MKQHPLSSASDDFMPVNLFFDDDGQQGRPPYDPKLIAILKAAKRKEERDGAARERPPKGRKALRRRGTNT